jgi:phenylacetate-CoA ligase
MLQWLSKHVFYPLWDVKENAHRLEELRRLEASQFWEPARVEALQLERLRDIVQHARATTQYYRESLQGLGADFVPGSLADLRRLPLVSKRAIRERADDFLSSAVPAQQRVEARTGGSTGTALIVYFDERCQEYRNAAAMRSDQWAGRDLGVKTAAIWGNPPVATGWRERFRNAVLNRLVYLDTMALNEESVRRFAALWRAQRPQVIFGHSHSIYVLARLARQHGIDYIRPHGIDYIRPRGIISTSMMLLDNERAVIEDVFQCKVTNRYGCEEVGLIACECTEHRGLHVNSEHVIVELLREDGSPAAPGEPGQVVVTDLLNRAMPLLRYQVEDVAVLSPRTCSCGRRSPLLEKVVGRVADFLVKADGTLVAGVSLVERTLTKIAGLDRMQIIQESVEHLQLNVVPGEGYTPESARQLTQEMHDVFGRDVRVELRELSALSQDRSGKYRFSICKVVRP